MNHQYYSVNVSNLNIEKKETTSSQTNILEKELKEIYNTQYNDLFPKIWIQRKIELPLQHYLIRTHNKKYRISSPEKGNTSHRTGGKMDSSHEEKTHTLCLFRHYRPVVSAERNLHESYSGRRLSRPNHHSRRQGLLYDPFIVRLPAGACHLAQHRLGQLGTCELCTEDLPGEHLGS